MTKRPDSPEAWYQQHKEATPSSAADKRSILHHAGKHKQRPALITFRQWVVAGAGGLALLVLVGTWQMGSLTQMPAAESDSFVQVELHGYGRGEVSSVQQFAARQSHYLEDYQQRMLNTAVRYQRPATVIEAEADGSLVLLTCNETMMQVSAELMRSLMPEQSSTTQFSRGEQVQLDFNQSGFILAITKQQPGLQCG